MKKSFGTLHEYSSINNAIIKRDLQYLLSLSHKQLSIKDKHGRTILHNLAINGHLEFLVACLCIGCNQRHKDLLGKTYLDYLEKWEADYVRRLQLAYSTGKLCLNMYSNLYDNYSPHAYSLDGTPVIVSVWQNNMSVDILEHILDSGIDMDSIRKYNPPNKYISTLQQYGWAHTVNEYSRDFYIPSIWVPDKVYEMFDTKPVGKIPFNYFGKTIVCISDTHWEHGKLHIPGGDILICAGDACMPWIKDMTEFLVWLGKQSHPYKIFVAGNHDKIFQNNKGLYLEICEKNNIVYLEDSGCNIDGIKFWGSPWTPKRPKNKNNAYTLPRKDLMKKWNLIPSETNVLITHCPPYGIGDCNGEFFKGRSYQGGDYGLKKTSNRLLQLKMHIFGHQHAGRGIYKGTNGVYYVNASVPCALMPYVFT